MVLDLLSRWPVGAFALLLALVAGCGGGDDAAPPTALPTTLSLTVPAAVQDVGSVVPLSSSLGSPPAGLTLSWDLGNGTGSSLAQPQAVYARGGVYTVSLTVTNSAGQSTSASAELQVADLALVSGKTCTGGGVSGWCWQRPLPQGNPLNSLFFVSDSTGWATGAAGTLMKTLDGGRTWIPRRAGTLAALHKVSFVDENVGWVSGDLGELLRTQDGGLTWHRASAGRTGEVSRLKAFDAMTAWVSWSGESLLTTDGGLSWKAIDVPMSMYGSQLSAASPTTLWAATYSGVARTADAGQTWQAPRLPDLLPNASRTVQRLEVIDAARAVVIATDSGWVTPYTQWAAVTRVFSTADGGASWRAVNLPADPDLTGSAVQVIDADHLLCLSNGQLRRSTDGGASWAPVTLPGSTYTYNAQLVPFTRSRWIVSGWDGKRHLTVDGGASWSEVLSGGPVSDALSGLWFHDAREGLAALSSGDLLRTDNGGQSWASGTVSGGAGWQRLQFLAGSPLGWIMSDQGTILRTLDKGRTWLAPVAQTSATMSQLRDFHFVDSQHGWALANAWYPGETTVYATADGGNSWRSLASRATVRDMQALRFADASRGVAVGVGGVALVTGDGGASWVPRATGNGQTLNRITLAGTGTFVAVGNAGTILRSADFGQTWQAASTPTRETLYDVHFIDALRGHAVGTNGTLLRTVDGGATWTARMTGTAHTLNSVFFLDAATGWVTGEWGTILVTVTGG